MISFKTFLETAEPCFKQYSKIDIENFKNSLTGINEAGDSASEVTWKNVNNNRVGTFEVNVGDSNAEYNIVISKYNKVSCAGLEIQEFKFFDENYDIKLSNNMTYHLGVGPTILKEFKKFIKDTQPEVAVFGADKYEKSRDRAYSKYAATVADENNYIPFYKTAITTQYHEYALVRPDCVEKFKSCFNISQSKDTSE